MNIGNEIIRLRNRNGLTQEAFAECVGVSRQAVAKWEKGDTAPELEKLVTISSRFNISLDSLVKGTAPCGVKNDPAPLGILGLHEFACEAKKNTYAAKAAEADSSRLNSHDLAYERDGFRYLDSYFGGEQFAGGEVIWKDDVPLWSMNYQGRVLGESFSGDFLKECLLLVSAGMPYRGPGLYKSGEYTYHCSIRGDMEWFRGDEDIFYGDDKVFECLFHGGILRS